MARLIKNTKKMILGVRISTVFEDKTTVDRDFKIGDIVENLRYVKDGDVLTVSGKIADIRYTMATKLAWNKKDPKDTLSTDMTLNDLVVDISRQYESGIVSIPMSEIVEFADETNVARMKYSPFIVYDMEMKYSDLSVKHASVQIGDIFDDVRIMNLVNPNTIGPDITGKFEVVGFSYAVEKGKIVINGIAFKNVNDATVHVAELDHILALNEVYDYSVDGEGNISEIVSNLADGDTITITNSINTSGSGIVINGKENININLQANVITDGAPTSGIQVTNGSAILSGEGVVTNVEAYNSSYGTATCAIAVKENGELTFDGSGIYAVVDNEPVDNGQFGVKVMDNGKLTINDGDFKAGWYCVSGIGNATSADALVTINGGSFISAVDYAIYHPDPGKFVINGGTFKGGAGAIAVQNGILEINGGNFYVLGDGDTGNWANGTSGLDNVTLNLNAKYGDVVCRITGGTFHAEANETTMIHIGTQHNVDLKISGGKFTEKPDAAWIAEGFVCTEEPDADGFYEVVAA